MELKLSVPDVEIKGQNLISRMYQEEYRLSGLNKGDDKYITNIIQNREKHEAMILK